MSSSFSESSLDTTEQLLYDIYNTGLQVDKDSIIPGSAGYLDNVLALFERHNHPFVLIGKLGMRWTGVDYFGGPAIDILIRSRQIQTIASDLVASGEWNYTKAPYVVDEKEVFHFEAHGPQDIWLEASSSITLPWELGLQYLRLWPEEAYKLSVDCGHKHQVPDIFPNEAIILEDEYCRDPKQRFGPRRLKPADLFPEYPNSPVSLPFEQRAKWRCHNIPIFVPTVAEFLNALLAQFQEHLRRNEALGLRRGSRCGNQIRLLIRYLYLDWEVARDWLLENKIQPQHQDLMRKACNRFVRKKVGRVCPVTKRVVTRKPWEDCPCGCKGVGQ